MQYLLFADSPHQKHIATKHRRTTKACPRFIQSPQKLGAIFRPCLGQSFFRGNSVPFESTMAGPILATYPGGNQGCYPDYCQKTTIFPTVRHHLFTPSFWFKNQSKQKNSTPKVRQLFSLFNPPANCSYKNSQSHLVLVNPQFHFTRIINVIFHSRCCCQPN